MLFVIPAQASSFPRRRESRFVRFQSFPIDSCRVRGSRFPLSREGRGKVAFRHSRIC
ncbi:hypothetical protein [Neisseria meningitidis serogroup B]|uniref:PilS cassette n=1 Tax=Neisseria meningitidis serogroup B TaxID=491 RepID=A0A0H5E004_NEIMI|nr:hypothetical protein [Neisseria meningitidis serogroup B]